MLAPPRQPDILLTEAEDEPAFLVSLIPLPAGPGRDRVFAGYIEARTYGRHLRWSGVGCRLIDKVDAKTRQAAERAEQLRIEAKRDRLSIRS